MRDQGFVGLVTDGPGQVQFPIQTIAVSALEDTSTLPHNILSFFGLLQVMSFCEGSILSIFHTDPNTIPNIHNNNLLREQQGQNNSTARVLSFHCTNLFLNLIQAYSKKKAYIPA